MTNGDRIRQKSNEELAEILSGNCDYCAYAIRLGKCVKIKCIEGIKAYLDMEVE